jgi:hypothetical protein
VLAVFGSRSTLPDQLKPAFATERKIRLLHALQTLIYVAVIVLSRRSSPWGFGAGTFIAALWNYTNICVTSFVKDGLEQLSILIQKGHLNRPDLLVAVIGAGGHFLVIAACLAGFLRLRPSARQWGQFLGGGAIAIAYFVAIIITTGPQYIPLLKRCSGCSEWGVSHVALMHGLVGKCSW